MKYPETYAALMVTLTKDKVMIACVTNEVSLIVQPAINGNIDRIHLIHYVKEDDVKKDRADFYRRFYEEVAGNLGASGIKVVEHSVETYIFRMMMSEIHAILREEVERGSQVYVNMSAGTSEYAAAAAICSMMFRDVEIFTVSKGYDDRTIDYGQLLENAKKDGRLVGSCVNIGKEYPVEKFPIQYPEDYLLKAFKIYSVITRSGNRNSNTVVIRNLINQGVWMERGRYMPGPKRKDTSVGMEDPEDGYSVGKTKAEDYAKRQRAEAVQYCRIYVDEWLERGWIESAGNRKYSITDEGQTVLDVFCPDSLIRFGEEDIVLQTKKYSD